MATKVKASREFKASADRVWVLIGAFGALADWHPAVSASPVETLDGAIWRRVVLADGTRLSERLEAMDNNRRTYAYSIPDCPLPVSGYLARIAVVDAGAGGCTVEWSSEFTPAGVPEADAKAAILGIYESGFDGIAGKLGG